MKTFFLLLAFCLIRPSLIHKKGEFKFIEETHDFGRVPINKSITYVFKFINVGEKPIIIFDVLPVCGCTIAEFTKTPVKFKEYGYIKVTFRSPKAEGFNKAVVVNSNANPPTKYLTIKGEVY